MHALVRDGAILRVHDFGVAAAPELAPNKGAWIEVAETDPPAHGAGETASPDIALVEGVPTRIWTVAANPAPRWTPLEFIERFTGAEQLAIVTAAQGNPALRLFYDKLMASLDVTADEPRVVAGMQALVDAGLITAERRAEILGA